MQSRFTVYTIVLLLGVPAVADAQGELPPAGGVDFGYRGSDISGDEARFQRFRDLRDGGFVEGLRFEKLRERWLVDLRADHVGWRDQRYFGELQHIGTLKMSFEWDENPLFSSRDTRTLYSEASPGVLRIDDSIQLGLQTGAIGLGDLDSLATPFDTRASRKTGTLKARLTASRDIDVHFNLKTAALEGTSPFGASFNFGEAREVAVPTDSRTTDVAADLEWANPRGMVRVGYDGSWYDNNIQTLIWDNPLSLVDTPTTPSQGRSALSPNNTAHTVSASGSYKLGRVSRATGYVSVGTWRQDESLLPHTINPAIDTATLALERQTADAEARIFTMNYTFNSRPNRHVWLTARYRYYDFDNRTALFPIEGYVRFDRSLREPENPSNEPFGYTRSNLDLDASFTPLPFAAIKVGYGRGDTDRTFRVFEETSEDVVRVSVDSTGNQWVSVRAKYEHATRTGSGLNEHVLELAGEQPEMRHFDIANRTRDRVTASVQVTPLPALGLNASVAAGQDDYPDSGFGLQDNDHRVYTFGVDVVPDDRVLAGFSYGFEKYTALQRSRQASPGAEFTDPSRDWSIDSDDKVHTWAGDLELMRLLPKTELQFGYDFTRSKARYLYGLVPGSPLAVPEQLPPVVNELRHGTVDVRYFLTEKVAIGGVYWYDRYDVEDFALGTDTIDDIAVGSQALLLGYVYRPYTAHTAWLRLSYFW